MILDDLIGEHKLTGVDFGTLPPSPEEYRYDSANNMAFVLDGRAYLVTEDPSDGYRSCMRDIQEVPVESVKNVFAPVRVLARMGSEGHYGTCDLLQCLDIVTGKIVLEAGTENSDDYYPSFVAYFTPENMACNQPVSAGAVDPSAADSGKPTTRD